MSRRTSHELFLDEVVGRKVRALDGAAIGRIEEMRCTGDGPYEITEYIIGLAGLFERLHIIHAVLGLEPRGYVATARQIDLTDPSKPVLTCDLSNLRRL